MSLSRIRQRLLLTVVACLVGSSLLFAADDTLAQAKELYASAAYDDALAMLDRLKGGSPSDIDVASILEQRVFCLLALERRNDAQKGIEDLLRHSPLYQLPDQTSPRIQRVFQEARRQMLPKIVLDRYAMARAAYERKDPQARAQFEQLLTLMDDPDLQEQPTIGDLRTVASAFRDLTQAMETAKKETPPASPTVVPTVVPPPPPGPPAVERVYSAGDANIVPPVARSQSLPDWVTPPGETQRAYVGSIELLVDERGTVVSAVMRASVHPVYDKLLVKAAKTWKFTPASMNGKPVRYLRVVEIRLVNKG